MIYEELANRIRTYISRKDGWVEKKMFGGIGFLLHGNMAFGVHKEFLVVRVGSLEHIRALTHSFTKPFDITGKSMSGWIMVSEPGYQTDPDLLAWLRLGETFAISLPPK
jgi:TfoX/Sxy family transcriptional regulator of competence genes